MTPEEKKALKVGLALRYGISNPCCRVCRYRFSPQTFCEESGENDVCELFESRASLKGTKLFAKWSLDDDMDEITECVVDNMVKQLKEAEPEE